MFMKRKNPEEAKIFLVLAGLMLICIYTLPLQADDTGEPGRESIVRSRSDKEIVIVSYDPAPGVKNLTGKEKIRIKRIYSNWISSVVAQWRRRQSEISDDWPRMSPRELSRACESYLRFLRNIDPATSSYLDFIPDENDQRKIINRLSNRTVEKIKQLQSGS